MLIAMPRAAGIAPPRIRWSMSIGTALMGVAAGSIAMMTTGCASSSDRQWAENSPLISPSEIGAPATVDEATDHLASVDSAMAGGTIEN